MHELQTILETSTARHSHLCPRQILGARIGWPVARPWGWICPAPTNAC